MKSKRKKIGGKILNKIQLFGNGWLSDLMLTIFALGGGIYFLIPDRFDYGQSSVWFLVLFAAFYGLIRYSRQRKNRLLPFIYEIVFSLLITFSLTLGFYFNQNRSFETLGFFSLLLLIVRTLTICPVTLSIIRMLCNGLAILTERELVKRKLRFRDWFIAFTVIFLLWLLVWMAYWPGFFNYDAWQVDEVLNHTYSKHHPLLHTLLLGNCYRIGLEQGDPNLGVILYCFIQIILLDAVLAFAVAFLRARLLSIWIPLLTLIYYAVFPVHSIMAISTTKDVLFSGLILLALLLTLIWMDQDRQSKKKGIPIALTIVLVFILLFRNNAKYCVILSILVCLIYIKQIRWRRALMILCISFGLYQVCDLCLTKVLSAAPGEITEALSVPIQQQGRIYTRLMEEESEQELCEDIAAFYDMNQAYYRPERADLMKFYIKVSKENLRDFINLTFRLFIRYPLESLDAFLYLTDGAWNLQDTSYADVYRGISDRAGVLFTDIKPDYGIKLKSHIPLLEQKMERLISENAYLEMPVLPVLFCPALYVFIFLFFVTVSKIYHGQSMITVPFFTFLLLTILAGPCIIIRYIYPYMICAPIFIFLVIREAGNGRRSNAEYGN